MGMFDEPGAEHVFYDIDTGHKKTLATCVLSSPQRYSIVRSNAPRFAESHSQGVPFGVYNLDTAHKKTLETVARDNRRFYASAFQSKQPRFNRPWTSPAPDSLYDVQKMSNSRPATVAHSLEATPQTYSILRSNYVRFQGRAAGEGSDVLYNLDCGTKKTLFTSMLESPIHYKNVGAQPTDLAPGKRPIRSDHAQKLGPGHYDSKRPQDISVSPWLDSRPLSSLMSSSPRFPRPRGGGGLGQSSTWSQDKDTRHWATKGFHMNKAEYLRPQYLPKAYLKEAKESRPAAAK